MNHNYARIAAAALLVGLIALVAVLSRDSERQGPASGPGAPVPAADDASASESRPLARVGSGTPSETSSAGELGRGAPGAGREGDPRAGEDTQGEAAFGWDEAAAARSEGPSDRDSGLPEGRGSVRFVIQDTSGRPLEAVSVSLHASRYRRLAEEAVTDERGEALFADLAEGRYAYQVEAPGSPERASTVPFRLEEGERKILTLRLGGSDLSIFGRVLNQNGEPVPGIEVSADHHLFLSSTSPDAVSKRDRQTTRTLRDGSYTFRGLEEREYIVRTTATDRYPSVRAVFRAGSRTADLLVVESLRAYGTVTDLSGEPLARVRVLWSGQTAKVTYSDPQGRYQIDLGLSRNGDGIHNLAFSLAGYDEELLVVEAPPPSEGPEVRVDVELRALTETATVSGVVETSRGEPIQGAPVYLNGRTRYYTVSDPDGNFSIPDVTIDSDYHFMVLPRSRYRDYREDIKVTRSDVWLPIVLEPLASGRLTGRMVDLEGNPIPNFRLWLVNTEAQHSSLPVSSNDAGYFSVDEAPEGMLAFDTRAFPMLRVSGIDLPAGGDRDVLLPLDWGDHVVHGSVLDERGLPVPGATVHLFSAHNEGEVQSTSRRKTVTDARGVFKFSQLGLGMHRLDVRASAYHDARKSLDVGSYPEEVEIFLEPISP